MHPDGDDQKENQKDPEEARSEALEMEAEMDRLSDDGSPPPAPYLTSSGKHEVHAPPPVPDDDPPGAAKHDKGKLRYDLIPELAMRQVAYVYTIGADKYGDKNWEKGLSWMRCIAALKRHLADFVLGESLDKDDGQHHLAAVVWYALAIMHYESQGPLGFDDRPVNVLAKAAQMVVIAQAKSERFHEIQSLIGTMEGAGLDMIGSMGKAVEETPDPNSKAAKVSPLAGMDDLTEEDKMIEEELAKDPNQRLVRRPPSPEPRERIEDPGLATDAETTAVGEDGTSLSVGKTRFQSVKDRSR